MGWNRHTIWCFSPLAVAATLFGAPFELEAQATGSITGVVVDARSGRPLAQAHVSIPALVAARPRTM